MRSLASESHRQHKALRTHRPLDWFSADFNDELSALDAHLLQRQTNFVARVVRFLLERYANASLHKGRLKVDGVILVGHSMGGVVGQAAVERLGCAGCVRTLLTLASPHAQSPLMVQVGGAHGWLQPAYPNCNFAR